MSVYNWVEDVDDSEEDPYSDEPEDPYPEDG